MREIRSDIERDVLPRPHDELREAVRREEEPPVIDLTLLPAAPRLAPVRDLQHWIDLCG